MSNKYISKEARISKLLENKVSHLEGDVSDSFKESIWVLIKYCDSKKGFTLFNDKRYNTLSFFSLFRLELEKILNRSVDDISKEKNASGSMVSSILYNIKNEILWVESKWRKKHDKLNSFIDFIQTTNMWISSDRNFSVNSRVGEINNELLVIADILVGIQTITSEVNKSENNNVNICKYCFRVTLSSWNLCCKNHASDTYNEKRTNTAYNRGKRNFNKLGDDDKKSLSLYKALRESLGDEVYFYSNFSSSDYLEGGTLLIDATLHNAIYNIQKDDWSQETIKLVEKHLAQFSNIFEKIKPYLSKSSSYYEFRQSCLSQSILDHEEEPSEHPYWLFQALKIENSFRQPRKNSKKSIT
ncbi:hypothetical protein [Marinomonas shanghaiensis]|uniref:hypothetical protein n=1 Tax=Marinomonas shanghaiensis TaxID=2202418 RepID=UPI000DB9BBF9|nr:hypothetical protein [Marinomonas shanghaiensis]